MSTTSPLRCQATSPSVANWSAMALSDPARPASDAERTKARSL